MSSESVIYANPDMHSTNWQAASEEGFGNKDNLTVFELGVYNGYLYGGTANATTGAEVWKTKGGDLPYKWEKVLNYGAGRGLHNEVAGLLVEFKGALYVGMGVINGGYHRDLKIGPAAAEILRLWPDDSWDLIVGEGRMTPQGLKVPLSGLAAGFGNLFNGYIWRMVVHDGHLYAGTMTWANMLPFIAVNAWPPDLTALVHRWGEDKLAELGGCELWRTADGVHWEPVTLDGFGNSYNWGIRTFASTPHGLFVGTTNPFGPRVAVRRNGHWSYQYNPRGGCEVWLGQPKSNEQNP